VLRLSKAVDYAMMALGHMAAHSQTLPASARDIARTYRIPASIMAKVLNKLSRAGLVRAERGAGGGYLLAKNANKISLLEVVSALDGPLYLTSCVTAKGACPQRGICTVCDPLQRVKQAIGDALSKLSVSEIAARTSDFVPEAVIFPTSSAARATRIQIEKEPY
jgi:Rrf2 family protein